ncbi:MAG: hypothetical protein HYU85_00060 [Chloroflexi bacterium]|nr:hypothetical protein [Chloroflexota bacterium]
MVKQKDEEIKGIRKISTFVTADALLAAILMVWAQLWIQPSVRLWAAWYGKEQFDKIPDKVSSTLQTFEWNVGFGLIWTYAAVFLALLALAWVGRSSLKNALTDKVPDSAVNLFMFSVSMALGNVLQSVFSVFIKLLLPNYSIWDPLRLPWSSLPGIVLFATPIVFLYILYASKKSE